MMTTSPTRIDAAGNMANVSRVDAAQGGIVNVLPETVRGIFHKIEPARGKAILFCSRARGEARADSDWDVLILLDKDRIDVADMDEVGCPISTKTS